MIKDAPDAGDSNNVLPFKDEELKSKLSTCFYILLFQRRFNQWSLVLGYFPHASWVDNNIFVNTFAKGVYKRVSFVPGGYPHVFEEFSSDNGYLTPGCGIGIMHAPVHFMIERSVKSGGSDRIYGISVEICSSMIGKNMIRHIYGMILVCGLFFGRTDPASAQINVTNFGAVGDLLTISGANTISNSTTVTCSSANFSAADINKLIEIYGAGTYQGQSNQDLFARIVTVGSPTSITISTPSGATATGLPGLYGTDNYPAFTNAIVHCPAPTGTIIIPAGNYFLLPPIALSTSGYDSSLYYTLALRRGGITFMGQGTAILTGLGGWVNYGGYATRGALFAMVMPMTNNYPNIFTNLVLDGGVPVGNIQNLAYPPSSSTGIGWDGNHHWMVAVAGGGSMIDSLVMANCTIRHWRGEMMEDTSGTSNLFLTVSNCLFCDGDGSCINNFAHNCTSCTFSNANQAEEFYRSYSINPSTMKNCVLEDLQAGVALNGGNYSDPLYTISGNIFTNFYGNAFAMYTTPACDVLFTSNLVYSTFGIALGSAGYQGSTVNSNIVVSFNTFSNVFYPIEVEGVGPNLVQDVVVCNNTAFKAHNYASTYGWSTNVFFGTNYGDAATGPLYSVAAQGQWFYDDLSNQLPAHQNNGVSGQTNIVSYSYGSRHTLYSGGSAVYALDDTMPGAIPAGAKIKVTQTGKSAVSLYASASLAGSPISLTNNQSVVMDWNGTAWVADTGGSQGGNTTPIIQVAPGSIDDGTILSGASVTNNFVVQNIGGGTLSGTASVAAPFSILSGGTYSLGSNQSQNVTVVFNPTAAGSYSQSIAFSGANGTNATVSGIATNPPVINPVITVTPATVDYGTILSGASATNNFIVQNTGGGTLTGTVSVAAPFNVVSGGSYNLAANQSQTVTVAFSPNTAGSYSQGVTFSGANGASATVLGSATNAPTVSPIITVAPASINFGTILNGTSATNTFTVQNTGGGTLTGAVGATAPFSVVSGGTYSLGSNQSQVVMITFSPSASGNYSQNIAFTGVNGTNAMVYGVATNAPSTNAVISVSPGKYAYGNIKNGKNKTNYFVIQNIGGGTLIGSATVAAPFRILSGASYSLTANQTQSVVVAFSPAASGDYSQNVMFTGGTGTNANVSGTGTNSTGAAPTVSAISANVSSLGTNSAMIEVQTGAVQLSATASATNNDTLSWQWLYSANGGSAMVYQVGTGTAPASSFTYPANAGGFNYAWILQVTDTRSGVSTQVQTNIYVQVPGTQILQIFQNQ